MLRALPRKAAAFIKPWVSSLGLLSASPFGSLAHDGPAADRPANLASLSPPPARQQEKQHVRLHSWQPFLSSAAAASQRPTNPCTPTMCKFMRTPATAAVQASAAKPSACQDRGLSTGAIGRGGGSSPSEQPCPLHACLLRHGVTDLAAFSAPRHLSLSQEVVSSNVEPKLAALEAEGLSPKQMALVFADETHSPLACSYNDTFQPNLELLQQVAAHMKYTPHPKAPQLTAVGKALTASPDVVTKYLARDPDKVQLLLQCLATDLGIGLEQLAACSSLCECLIISASSAHAAIAMLSERRVPVQQVARITLVRPTLLRLSPTTLAAKLALLEDIHGLNAVTALRLAVGEPILFSLDIKARLPPLLRFLDSYMGEEGAGRRLMLAQPAVGTVRVAAAERSTGSLATRGYSQQEIQGKINSTPTLLKLDLDSPLQQQKLDWIERVSPWTLDDFLATPTYFLYSTSRMAARLALLRECKLQSPSTPGRLALPSSATFIADVRRRLARQGRELPWASWAEWEEAWLGTEEGREWGFPPLKD